MVSIIDFYVLQKRPSKEGFDIVIGNPPYIRFQFFDRNQQAEAGDIFIGKLKTENIENNIALELYYSLSRYYKVAELPFVANKNNDHQFRF